MPKALNLSAKDSSIATARNGTSGSRRTVTFERLNRARCLFVRSELIIDLASETDVEWMVERGMASKR